MAKKMEKGALMVSVIIPVYNTADYLERCIDSVLNSSYEDFEIILINDGSVDRSGFICEEYQKRDQRIRYFSQMHRGVSAARNKGIEVSRGTWIVFVDSDDFISPHFLGQIAKRESGSQELLIFDYTRKKERGSRNGKNIKEKGGCIHYGKKDGLYLIQCLLNMRQLHKKGSVSLSSPCAKAYKRSVIERYKLGFAEDIKICEDRLFNVEYLLRARQCIYIPEIVYFVEVRNNSSMRGFIPDFLQNDIQYQEKLRVLLKNYGFLEKAEAAFYNSILTNMADVLVRGIFHPRSPETYEESCRQCCSMQEVKIYQEAIKNNRRTGSLPRRILLIFYRRKKYRAVKFICVASYRILEIFHCL